MLVFAAFAARADGDVRWSMEAGMSEDRARADTLFNPGGALLDAQRRDASVAGRAVARWESGPLFARFDGWVEADHADEAGDDRVRGTLAEAWLQWQPRDGRTFSAGVGAFRWGTGYIWNPANPLADVEANNTSRARTYRRDGDRFISFEQVSGANTLSLHLAEIRQSDAMLSPLHASERWAVLRGQRVFDGGDATLFLGAREGERFAGAATSWTVGDALELHAEAGVRSQRRAPTFTSIPLGPPGTPQLPVWNAGTRKDWTPSALVGGQYTFDAGINLIVEFMHDGNGYDDGEYAALRAAATDANALLSDPVLGAAARGFLLDANRIAGRLRRNYAFVRIAHDGLFDKVDAHAYVRRGIDDASSVFGWLLRWPLGTSSSLAIAGEHLRGGGDAEARLVPVRDRYQLVFKYDF